jgi:predicted permease
MDAVRNIRHAFRGLLKAPVFAVVAVVILGIGIGVNSAMFSILHRLFLKPPGGIGDPEGLVRVQMQPPQRAMGLASFRRGASYVDYLVLSGGTVRTGPFAELAAYAGIDATLTGEGSAQPTRVTVVSGNYFDVLRVQPSQGRLLTGADVPAGTPAAVAVLSHAFWQRHFGGKPVLDKTIEINGSRVAIVGVAPREFSGVDIDAPDLWMPLNAALGLGLRRDQIWSRHMTWLRMVGRPKAGVPQARVATDATLALLRAEESFGVTGTPEQHRSVAVADIAWFGADETRSPVPFWMLGVTGLVLLIACANIANLLLVRATGREREMAVRLSLGATRAHLIKQLLTESLVLAVVGGCAALLLAAWAGKVLAFSAVPGTAGPIDGTVVLFTAGLAFLTVVFFGLVPAVRASSVRITTTLSVSAPQTSPARSMLRDGLVVLQLALSLMLLAGTGLMLRSLRNVTTIHPGFDLEHLVSATVSLAAGGYGTTDGWELAQRARAQVQQIPDVRLAAYGEMQPFYLFSILAIRDPDQPDLSLSVGGDAVDPDYFRTLGIPVLLGRAFTADDRVGSEPVAVVNEALARVVWRGENALGRCLVVEHPCLRIVGVVGDARHTDLRQPGEPRIYEALLQQEDIPSSITMFIRTADRPEDVVAAVRHAIQSLDPRLPNLRVAPVKDAAHALLAQLRIGATLLTILGGIALILSAVGLYGVIAYAVSQRTHEIGIRLALGARRGDIIGLVLKRVLILAGVGLLLGLPAALAMARVLSSRLYGVGTTDPTTYATIIAVLTAVAILAGWIPARRAASVDVVKSLRHE